MGIAFELSLKTTSRIAAIHPGYGYYHQGILIQVESQPVFYLKLDKVFAGHDFHLMFKKGPQEQKNQATNQLLLGLPKPLE